MGKKNCKMSLKYIYVYKLDLLDSSIVWKCIKKLQKNSAHAILYFLFMVTVYVYVCVRSWQVLLNQWIAFAV